MPPQPCWYNGALNQSGHLEISTSDPGLLYGATVFTTLRIYQQSLNHPLTHWSGHRDRLSASVQSLGWQLPNWHQVQAGLMFLESDFPVLRVTLFPDGRELITGRSLPADLAHRQTQGISAWLADPSLSRSLPHDKTGNYLAPWLAQQKAQDSQAQEAILVNTQGEWLETATGNLWGWRDGCWWTPPLSAGILPGLVRSQLVFELRCHNEKIREDPWLPDLVLGFEAIAYSNSVVQIVPIHTVTGNNLKLTYAIKHQGFEQLRGLFHRGQSENPDIGLI